MLRSFVRHAILHRAYKSIGISEPQCRRNMQMLHMRSVRLQGKGKAKLDADMKQRIAAHSFMNNCVQKGAQHAPICTFLQWPTIIRKMNEI